MDAAFDPLRPGRNRLAICPARFSEFPGLQSPAFNASSTSVLLPEAPGQLSASTGLVSTTPDARERKNLQGTRVAQASLRFVREHAGKLVGAVRFERTTF
jgi:hypothetical protein